MGNYNRQLIFYTDGSYSRKSGMGGWAMICIENDTIIDKQSGYEPYTTGNRMEIMAFLCAFETINTIPSGRLDVTIYTDSAYVANTFNQNWYKKWLNNGWKTADKQDVKNQDLWGRVIALYIKLKAKLSSLNIEKVKGHSGIKYNEMVDDMAVRKRKELED